MSSASAPATDRGGPLVGGALTLAGALAGAALAFLAEALLARTVGASGYGVFAVGLAVMRVGERLCTVGLPIATLHFAPTWPMSGLRSWLKSYDRWVLTCMTAASVAYGVAAAIVVQAFSLTGSNAWQAAAIGAIAVPALCAIDYYGNLARALGASWPYVLARNIVQPLGFATAVVLVLWSLPERWQGGPAALFGWAMSAALAAWVAAAAARRVVARIDPEPANAAPGASRAFDPRRMLQFAGPAWSVTVLYAAVAWIDLLLVAGLRPAADAGLYRAALVAVMALDLLAIAVNAVMARRLAAHHHGGDVASLQRAVEDSIRASTVGSCALALALGVHAPAILALIGPGFERATDTLVVLVAAMAWHCALGPLGLLALMTGRHRQEAWSVAAALVVLVTATVVLGLHWGLPGVATAKLLSLLTLNVHRLATSSHGWKPYAGVLRTLLLAGMATLAAGFALAPVLSPLRGGAAVVSMGTLVVLALLTLVRLVLTPAQRLPLLRAWRTLIGRRR